MSLKLVKRAAEAFTGGPRQQIEAIRARRLELLEVRKQTEGARRPFEEAEARLGRLLDQLASDLDINLSALADHREERLPEILRIGGGDVASRINDRLLLALLVGANRDGCRKVLAAKLREGYDHGGALAGEERTRRLEEIDAELLRLEIDEERIIRESEEAGMPLLRRGDAYPAIVLLSTLAA